MLESIRPATIPKNIKQILLTRTSLVTVKSETVGCIQFQYIKALSPSRNRSFLTDVIFVNENENENENDWPFAQEKYIELD